MNQQQNMSTLPLTLTLSLGEREQPLAGFLKFGSHRVESVFRSAQKVQRGLAKKLEAFLPLPGGEGRGEGELTIHSF